MSKTIEHIYELLAQKHYSMESGCDAHVELCNSFPKFAQEFAELEAENARLKNAARAANKAAAIYEEMLARAVEALESIADGDDPTLISEDYWRSAPHVACAEIIATDTQIAREALKDIQGGKK